MRIKQISVNGLFGIFDHIIPLNRDERITVIHSPNGFGKTAILTILNGFFNSQYSQFKKIPFKSFKEINFSKEKGFVFTTHDKQKLSPTDLSSGEQHELVLLFGLLFKTKPNSLVLIDEPELSLHVAWQVEFLKDLKEITELRDLDILMATHSPDIIQDRWDLTVELKRPD